jgi:4-amino-4-deoxy-L-arabinose transferase-like glycosyltransferase
MRRDRALKILAVVALLGAALTIRLDHIQHTPYRVKNDAGSYLTLASEIAHTGQYSNKHTPGSGAGGTKGPSAYFAPGFPYFLAAVDLLSGHTERRRGAVQPARVAQAVLGTVTVALIGLVAWEAFGELVAFAALALAAVYPVLVELSGTLVAENLLTPLVLAAVAAALRIRHSSRPYLWALLAGVLSGLSALSHENAVLILIPLGFAAAGAVRRQESGRWWSRLIEPTLLVAAALLTIAPWTIRNAADLHRFIPISDETGITLVGTYNPASAANPLVPYKWRLYYGVPGEHALIREAGHLTEPQIGDRLQSQAFSYIAHHPLAPLAVAFHNTLRLFELEGTYAWHASAKAISLPIGTARVGVTSLWILCALAIAGALTPAARRGPLWLWAVPLLLALSVVLVNVETPRFREPVDPFLILLAACAVATPIEKLVARRARPRQTDAAAS